MADEVKDGGPITKPKSATSIDITIGNAIRAKRVASGMSMKELALSIGISWQQLYKYENGSNRVSASRLWIISSVLTCDITCFYEPITARSGGENG